MNPGAAAFVSTGRSAAGAPAAPGQCQSAVRLAPA